MVARKQTPEGKRVTMGVKFSEPEAEAIDAARGNVNRSEWLRTAALAALGRQPPGAPPTMPPAGPPPRPRRAAAPVRFREPEPERTPKNCKHPNMRVSKGVCPDCCEWVASKPKT